MTMGGPVVNVAVGAPVMTVQMPGGVHMNTVHPVAMQCPHCFQNITTQVQVTD